MKDGIKRVIPLEEVKARKDYWDMAELAQNSHVHVLRLDAKSLKGQELK